MALRRLPPGSLARLARAGLGGDEDAGTARLMRTLGAARRRGHLTPRELEAVCRWKSARAIHHVRANTRAAVRGATRAALAARDEGRRMEALLALRGVSVPMASALLTLLRPRRYAVIDIRVWQLLHRAGAVRANARGAGFTVGQWREFLLVVRGLAARLGATPRAVERALFEVHRAHQHGTLYPPRPQP